MIPARAILAATILLALSGCEVAVVGAAVYYGQDGFRWEVEDHHLGADLYRITVRQGKLTGGGQGEAGPIFRQRAEEIAAVQGCAGYTVLEYQQRLENDVVGVPQRVTEGLIRCNPAPAANSQAKPQT